MITVINCRKLGAGCWKPLILVRKRLLVVENGPFYSNVSGYGQKLAMEVVYGLELGFAVAVEQ